MNTVSKNNPLIKLAEDFELKMADVEGLQFILPWQGTFSGPDIGPITKEAAEVKLFLYLYQCIVFYFQIHFASLF